MNKNVILNVLYSLKPLIESLKEPLRNQIRSSQISSPWKSLPFVTSELQRCCELHLQQEDTRSTEYRLLSVRTWGNRPSWLLLEIMEILRATAGHGLEFRWTPCCVDIYHFLDFTMQWYYGETDWDVMEMEWIGKASWRILTGSRAGLDHLVMFISVGYGGACSL